MERIVLFLCGLWFWITRKYRAHEYQEVADFLDSARVYLSSDFNSRWSTRDRGGLLPDQAEALTILKQQSAEVASSTNRLRSLTDCVRLVKEELSDGRTAA